jgi:hypothetical protein
MAAMKRLRVNKTVMSGLPPNSLKAAFDILRVVAIVIPATGLQRALPHVDLPKKQAPRRTGAASRAVRAALSRARKRGFAFSPSSTQREVFAGRVAIMLSKLATGLWRLIREGFMARGGRYWST